MKKNHENPFDSLSELELNCSSEFDLISEKEIRAELRFAEDTLDAGSYDIDVSVSSAILYVQASGSEVVPGSRLADESRGKRDYEQKLRQQTTLSKALEMGADFSAGPTGPTGRASSKKTSSKTDEIEIEITQRLSHRSVRSMSGNRWRVQESDTNTGQIPLDGTYIANEVLCAISPSEKTNTVAVEACIVVRKRDFIVTPSGNPLMREFRERVHREKFMSAILAKSLAKQSYQSSSAKDTGRFILSRSTLSMDDDD